MKEIYFLLLTSFLFSCSAVEEQEQNASSEKADLFPSGLKYEKNKTVSSKGIFFNDIIIDSLQNALRVSFKAKFSEAAFQKLKNRGCDGIFVNLIAKSGKGSYNLLSNETKRYGTRLHAQHGPHLLHPEERPLHFLIPYRKLKLPSGTHKIHIFLQALPEKVSSDSSFKKLRFISPDPVAEEALELRAKTPPLFRSVIRVHNVILDKKALDVSRFDWSFGGPGYPDLYWEILCSGESIYSSPVRKNSTAITGMYTSPEFYSGEKDVITINIIDHDKGPFNKKDIITSWEGNLRDLPVKKESMPFGSLKEFIVESSMKKLTP